MMRRLGCFALSLAVLCLGGSAFAQAPARLMLTSPPELVDCAPVTQTPCMGARVTPVDADGNPAPMDLPSRADLAASLTLTSGPNALKPFFVSSGLGPDAAEHINVVLLMIDISGSMNQTLPSGGTRFDAAKDAIAKYLGGMQEGYDRIAIVPFESHSVVSTIRSAVFAQNRTDALAQLSALPRPQPHNNTALYQAVFSGVGSLQEELTSLRRDGHLPGELQPHLIVMTDGRNEVTYGDDPQLLNGPLGLQQATAQVQASHLDTIAIGFGEHDAIDAVAMKRFSTRFFYAADANQLLDALHVSRAKQSHEITMLWTLPETSRLELTGRDQHWVPTMALNAASTIPGDPISFMAPAFGPPSFTRRAGAQELQALIAAHPPSDSGWSVVLTNVLALAAAGLVILVLWFWVPRLVWGDRYAGAPVAARRWSNEKSTTTAASGVQIRYTENAPAGFTPEASSGPIQRSAAQKTQVQPRNEFSRTRLTFDTK